MIIIALQVLPIVVVAVLLGMWVCDVAAMFDRKGK